MAIILPEDEIDDSHALTIYNMLCDEKSNNIVVLLHSGGGDISPAYKIVDVIKNHYKQISLIIPLYAKIAAVLFALASNNIIMSEIAELGPLDVQIGERKHGEKDQVSALSTFKALEEIRQFSLDFLDDAVQIIVFEDLSLQWRKQLSQQ